MATIPRHVAGHLRHPVPGVGSPNRFHTTRFPMTSVPDVSSTKHDNSCTHEDHIGFSHESSKVLSQTKTTAPQHPPVFATG
jgi:hypothetical protein